MKVPQYKIHHWLLSSHEGLSSLSVSRSYIRLICKWKETIKTIRYRTIRKSMGIRLHQPSQAQQKNETEWEREKKNLIKWRQSHFPHVALNDSRALASTHIIAHANHHYSFAKCKTTLVSSFHFHSFFFCFLPSF